MIRWLLRLFGFYHITYGFACGRHWVEIDGVTICQSDGDDLYMPDQFVHALGWRIVDHGKYWEKPGWIKEREDAQMAHNVKMRAWIAEQEAKRQALARLLLPGGSKLRSDG